MTGPTYEEKRRIFERNYLLGKFNPDEIDKLMTYSRIERYAAGHEIFPKGSPGTTMMAVVTGTVRISSISLTGKEVVLNIINPGEIFGEIALLDGGERSGDAVAIKDCELLVLNRRDFMPFLENHLDICMMLIRMLCKRVRHTSEQVEDLLFRHLEARIAKALLQLAEGSGRGDIHRVSLDLHLSQRDLANMVGCSRESVNKQVQVWHKAGLIEVGKGSIVIRNAAAIEQLI